jgi:hypothetical protein
VSPNLDEALCKKYPKIFVNRHESPQKSPMFWGFECGDGWYDLIDQLCHNLQFNTDHNSHIKDKYPQVVAMQVKEKFGELRFYVQEASDVQYAVIHFASELSGHICDVCGKPGKRGGSGWIRTRCEEHAHTDA